MSTASATTRLDTEEHASWVPMMAIALGQMIMSFNVASLPVALGPSVREREECLFALFRGHSPQGARSSSVS